MWKDNLVFYKGKIYLKFLYKYWLSQKPSHLATNLYDQVYFTFNLSLSYAVLSVPCGIVVAYWRDWPLGFLVCGVFLCFDAFTSGVLSRV